MIRFFNPSAKWIDWLAKYAGDRIVVDVGCGDGHLVQELAKRKVKVLGIDPRYIWDDSMSPLFNMILPMEAQKAPVLRTQANMLVLFCRPCHSGFVQETIDILHPTAEVLYISKPCNVGEDIVDMDTEALKTPRCPEERVYRVLRPVLQERAIA